MSILEFIEEMIKVYFINRKGKCIFATWAIIAIMTCSVTSDVRTHPYEVWSNIVSICWLQPVIAIISSLNGCLQTLEY